jgi:hypothetical protein
MGMRWQPITEGVVTALFFWNNSGGIWGRRLTLGKKKMDMPTKEIMWVPSGNASSTQAGGWRTSSLRLF